MGYRNLRQCVDDLEKSGHLRRVTEEVDPYLEVAEIQRRVYANGGPALYFERVKGCQFPLVSNLYGTPGTGVVRRRMRSALGSERII